MDVENFLDHCRPLDGGFFGIDPEVLWRLGAVLFARSDNWFAAVQKAPKHGYEFSDQWTLPGGMIREAGDLQTARAHIDGELAQRVRAEAGLQLQGTAPIVGLGPVVTSYTVADIRRFTLVAGFESAVVSKPPLQPSDRSIQAACWTPQSTDLQVFAPGNCVIIGHIIWPSLEAAHRDSARRPITEALEICAGWSNEVGVAPPPPPWAAQSAIEEWSKSWPGDD